MDGIYLIATTTNSIDTPDANAMPPSDKRAFYYEAQAGETVDDVVDRVSGVFGLGCTLIAVDASADALRRFVIGRSLDPVE